MKSFVAMAAIALVSSFSVSSVHAQALSPSTVTVNLLMNASQTLEANDCRVSGLTGTVISVDTIQLNTTGKVFTGTFPCPAVEFERDVFIKYIPVSSTNANIEVTNVYTTSAAGKCHQTGLPVYGTAGPNGGSASGTIAGTAFFIPWPCQFQVVFDNTPALSW